MKLGFAYRFTTDETGQLVGEVIGQRGNIPVSYWVRADRRSTPDELVPALDAMLEKNPHVGPLQRYKAASFSR